MYITGAIKKNNVPIIKLGTVIKNFDFIFCDFIKHPIASIIKENIKLIVKKISINLKLAKKMENKTFSKLFI